MKNKGFTLIELIAVIVILGMLLVIVIPATGRLIASNDKRLYDEYYDLVRSAALRYARGESYDLGGVSHSGCKTVTTLEEFFQLGILKSYKTNDENIECYLPSEIRSLYEEGRLKLKSSDVYHIQDNKPVTDFYDIRIENDKGNIVVKHSLICVRDDKKIVYQKLIPKDVAECKKYEADRVNILYSYLVSTGTGSPNILKANEGNIRFVKDNIASNYVKYSGRLWQIVNVNTDQETIKLVLADPVTYYNFDETTSSSYRDSNIDKWIDEEFKPTLRNPGLFLQDAPWSFTASSTNAPSAAPAASSATEVQSLVGLLNLYEYNKAKTSIATTRSAWFLMTPKDGTNIWMVQGSSRNVQAVTTNTAAGIRPSIVLRKGVTYVQGGNGTASNPYTIVGEQSGLVGEKINTRFVGEYVKFANKTYRITSITNEGTKMMTNELSSQGYFDNSNIYTFGTAASSYDPANRNMKYYLDQNFYNGITEKSMLVEQEYCVEFWKNTSQYKHNYCPNSDKRNGPYSVPRIGDMYVVPAENGESYWTLTPSKAETDPISGEIKDPEVYMMTSTGIVSKNIRTDGKYYPVLMISPKAVISGGAGTSASPYTIKMPET